jgi:rhamnogalacturonyl hydrolase YesR
MRLHLLTTATLLLTAIAHPHPQNGSLPYSLHMANSIISRHQGILASTFDRSNLLQAGFTQKVFRQLIHQYPNHSSAPDITAYIRSSIESVVPILSNATLDTTFPLDRLSSGNGLIYAYQESGNQSYKHAYEALAKSIDLQPRNHEGSLWYYTYPNYTYLDGMYSLAPFATLYSSLNTSQPPLLDVVDQLALAWNHTYQNTSGLLVHGYDASKRAIWANATTGASPIVWGRSLGWYVMALMDTLELLDRSNASRKWIEGHFALLMSSIVNAADKETGAWYQVLDQPGREGNYVESSVSAMIVYGLLKGVRAGVLEDEKYVGVARKAYEYMVEAFVVENGNGTLGWEGTVSVCSLNSSATYEVCIAHGDCGCLGS